VWLGAAVAAAAAGADAPSLPKPNRYVTDRSGFLPPERAAALNEKLAAFERSTSDQILVYVDRRVPDWTTLEELGARSIREWGVGRKGKSNGVIFFVFPDERKMRIEVGYGLEGAITDARARRITDEVVKPFFREGNWAGGIEAGVDAILAAARGEPFGGTGKTAAEAHRRVSGPSPVFLVLGVAFLGFWALMAFFIVRGIRRSPAAAAPGGGAVRRGGLTTGSGEWSAASLAAGESSWASSSSSGLESMSDSSSSSSSDFSGGGGDGGGGGSSDSW